MPVFALNPEVGVVIVSAEETVTVAVSEVVEAVRFDSVFVTITRYPPESEDVVLAIV